MEPATAALDHHLARSLLRSAVTWLELEAEAGRRHGWRAREIGAVAMLGGFGGFAGRAERLMPDEGHVHADDDDHSMHDPHLPHGDELAQMFPAYSSVAVLNGARQDAPPHLSLALARHFDEAWARCESDSQREDVICVRALLGDFSGALTLLARPGTPHERQLGPLMVIAVEALRLGDGSLTRKLVLEDLERHDGLDWWIPVAAGLLGRLPWPRYPLPEH